MLDFGGGSSIKMTFLFFARRSTQLCNSTFTAEREKIMSGEAKIAQGQGDMT